MAKDLIADTPERDEAAPTDAAPIPDTHKTRMQTVDLNAPWYNKLAGAMGNTVGGTGILEALVKMKLIKPTTAENIAANALNPGNVSDWQMPASFVSSLAAGGGASSVLKGAAGLVSKIPAIGKYAKYVASDIIPSIVGGEVFSAGEEGAGFDAAAARKAAILSAAAPLAFTGLGKGLKAGAEFVTGTPIKAASELLPEIVQMTGKTQQEVARSAATKLKNYFDDAVRGGSSESWKILENDPTLIKGESVGRLVNEVVTDTTKHLRDKEYLTAIGKEIDNLNIDLEHAYTLPELKTMVQNAYDKAYAIKQQAGKNPVEKLNAKLGTRLNNALKSVAPEAYTQKMAELTAAMEHLAPIAKNVNQRDLTPLVKQVERLTKAAGRGDTEAQMALNSMQEEVGGNFLKEARTANIINAMHQPIGKGSTAENLGADWGGAAGMMFGGTLGEQIGRAGGGAAAVVGGNKIRPLIMGAMVRYQTVKEAAKAGNKSAAKKLSVYDSLMRSGAQGLILADIINTPFGKQSTVSSNGKPVDLIASTPKK